METLKVFEAFAGVGAQRMALRNIGLPHEVVAISEIDKFAISSYEAIHGPVNNVGDISKVDVSDLPDFDLFTYSFPCQDISNAGLSRGFGEGSNTRSSLLWECERIIEGKRPKYLLLENVKNLIGKAHIANFEKWLDRLDRMGYSNYWGVLNATDFDVPQRRERVFVISILGEHSFDFPQGVPTDKTILDVMEDEVDESYYLSEERLATFTPRYLSMGDLKVVGDVDFSGHQLLKRVYSTESKSPTLDSMGGGNREPKIILYSGTKDIPMAFGDVSDLGFPASKTRRGRVRKGIAPTLTVKGEFGIFEKPDSFRIRKLTPLECWRLMGFSDEDYYKAEAVNFKSQLYKQAGNSIVVPVLEAIFRKMFWDKLPDGKMPKGMSVTPSVQGKLF